jgi:ribosome-associated protein
MPRYHNSAMQDEIVSKTKRKQEMHALQALGAALVALPEAQLSGLSLESRLHEAVVAAKRIKSHEAKRRQMQYIGRLMREVDPEPIRERLAAIEGYSAQASAKHRRLEAWRERLLAGDEALTEFAAEFPGTDVQALRTLLRNARKEMKERKPPRAYREVFRLLKEFSTSTK